MDWSPTSSREELLALLCKQILEREATRDNIDKSIQVLKEAERELRRQVPLPAQRKEEQTEHLPYRIHIPSTTSPEGAFFLDEPPPPDPVHPLGVLGKIEESHLLGRPPTPRSPAGMIMDVGEPSPVLQKANPPTRDKRVKEPAKTSQNLAFFPPERMDELLQEEQMSLLGGGTAQLRYPREPSRSDPPEVRTKPSDPFLKTTESAAEIETPTRADVKRRTNGRSTRAGSPSIKLHPTPFDRLMKHIRSGGAVRCQDPWDQNCVAFLLASDGTFILATDVFLNYIRKSIQGLRKIHENHLADRVSSPSSATHLEDLENRKHFLSLLTKSLSKQNPIELREVSGLKISGQNAPAKHFAFENSTKAFLHTRSLLTLQELMAKPINIFFLENGPYFKIVNFLSQYKNFTRETGEETLAMAMIGQLGLAFNSKANLSSAPPEKNPLYDGSSPREDEYSFGIGEISPSRHTEMPPGQKFNKSPEREDTPDTFSFNNLKN